MLKSLATIAVAFAFMVLLGSTLVPAARAKDGVDIDAPECQIEDGGVVVCQ